FLRDRALAALPQQTPCHPGPAQRGEGSRAVPRDPSPSTRLRMTPNDVRLMSTKSVLEKTIAVGLVLPDIPRSVAEEHLAELEKLIETAGGVVVERELARRSAPDPATFVGKGKAEQLETLVHATGATLIVFDDDLSPAQARNLEKATGAAVIDRSGLILDIFAGRARSREARTQVELAQLEYTLPRLTRAWTHLERQAGGIGTRGVGETQIELDRRIIRNRIAHLKEELRKIERTRDTQRKARSNAFTVALVGYTNAGNSTLFNQLTRGGAVAVDKLFATLDAKSQRAAFEMPRETVVIDTVGFIQIGRRSCARSSGRATRSARRAATRSPWRWSATRTPGSRRSSTSSPAAARWRSTSCSRRSTRNRSAPRSRCRARPS